MSWTARFQHGAGRRNPPSVWISLVGVSPLCSWGARAALQAGALVPSRLWEPPNLLNAMKPILAFCSVLSLWSPTWVAVIMVLSYPEKLVKVPPPYKDVTVPNYIYMWSSEVPFTMFYLLWRYGTGTLCPRSRTSYGLLCKAVPCIPEMAFPNSLSMLSIQAEQMDVLKKKKKQSYLEIKSLLKYNTT